MNEPERSSKTSSSLFVRILKWVSGIVLACLLASYLAPYISPESFWLPALFGLAYPFLLGIACMIAVLWLLANRKWAVVCLVAILIGWGNLSSFFRVNFSEEKNTEYQPKVMSFNVRLFDLYNWTNNKRTRDRLFRFLKREEPDILCLQEFYNDTSGDFKTLDTMVQFLNARNVHAEYTKTVKKVHLFGIATFTSYPILQKGIVPFPEKSNNICIFTDVKMRNDTVRIYNMHLQSYLFDKSDYKFVEDMQGEKETDELNGSKKLFAKMKTAFQKRAAQADRVAAHITACRYKIIVCGDFNDTPFSYTYRTISRNLTDAFRESGSGFGKTYFGEFPSYRIDYILHSKNISSSGFITHPEKLSDHYPVSCKVKVN